MADVIDNDEGLLRAVRNSPGEEYKVLPDGTVKVASSAFNDSTRQPSVDREGIRSSPLDCTFNPDDGVVRLLAEQIRKIDSVRVGPKGDEVYDVDVIHRPLERTDNSPANPAHSQVEYTPGEMSGTKFKKLKEALAFIANTHDWVIKPGKK